MEEKEEKRREEEEGMIKGEEQKKRQEERGRGEEEERRREERRRESGDRVLASRAIFMRARPGGRERKRNIIVPTRIASNINGIVCICRC